MKGKIGSLFGIQLIENHAMIVEDGEEQIKRTIKERLFTLPWQPFKKYRYRTKYKPADYAIQSNLGGVTAIIAHPVYIDWIKKNIGNDGFTIKCKGLSV